MPKTSQGTNLFEQHVRLMELAGREPLEQDREEAERARAMHLFPWNPPATRRPRRRPPLAWLLGLSSFLAVSVCCILFFKSPASTSQVQYRGASVASTRATAWPLWQRGGRWLDWASTSEAVSGASFSAEVKAEKPTLAILGVLDRHHQLLSDPARMLKNRLELVAGAHGRFSEGFELTAENEGEILAVLTCEQGILPESTGEQTVFIRDQMTKGNLDARCTLQSFRLR